MPAETSNSYACQICGKGFPPTEVLPGELVRDAIVEMIKRRHAGWSPEGFICLADLRRFRMDYVQHALEEEHGELGALERDVVSSLREQETLSTDVDAEFERRLTLGERAADRLASFGGSWSFIAMFSIIILVWISMNSIALLKRPFDPYPFILLNLVLSSIAALQAPIIMMSQNRQEAKDRLRSEYDYRVNLKAELEIRHLSAKLDQLMTHQWNRLMEIQRIQMELLEEQRRDTTDAEH
jgi:uncharacterized membrane protein